MEVASPDLSPVHDLDTELEGRLGGCDELVLVDSKQLVEADERWDRCLPDANRPDLLGLDQGGLRIAVVEKAREGRRRHPAGGPATDDDDLADAVLVHWARRTERVVI